MGVRYRSKRRCRNCPETKEGLPIQVTPIATTYQGEGRELWRAATVACGTLLELLFRYVALDVPGEPLPQFERLRTRLNELIEARKEREKPNESSSFEN